MPTMAMPTVAMPTMTVLTTYLPWRLRVTQALREAWAIFDPLGLGRLSLREFSSACGLIGMPAGEGDIAREFRKIDLDASGAIELAEFGVVLRRLASLAKGQTRQQLHSGASATTASRVGGEFQLLEP